MPRRGVSRCTRAAAGAGASSSFAATMTTARLVDDDDNVEEDDDAAAAAAFVTFDRDGDGRISFKELENLFGCLGYECDSREMRQLFAEADINRNGFIDLQEFLSIVSRKRQHDRLRTEKQMAKAFRVFDSNGDGYISASELRSVLKRLLPPAEVTASLIDDMISGADTDGDGRVSYEEFVAIVTMQ